MRKIICLVCCCMCAFIVHAAPTSQDNSMQVTPAEKTAVTHALEKLSKTAGKKFPVTNISTSPVPGLLQVTSDLSIFYVSTDGEFLVIGDILDINKDRNSWSVTENAMRKLRVGALAAVKPEDMIIFSATAAKIGTITVFTDIDCPYCRKMQESIKEYTDQGIEVRYLSFPRTGPKTPSFDEAIKVWCAPDKAKAYIAAIETKEFPKKSCTKNPVKMEYDLGQKMGISGTPTIILDNGTKLGGLVDPKTLAKLIKNETKG